MIASWRKHWHEASGGATPAQVPFGFMQLSTWSDKANGTCGDGLTHADSASCDVGVVSTATDRSRNSTAVSKRRLLLRAQVRWGQTANVGSVPNDKMPGTFMAVAVDLGDALSPFGDIHPRYKKRMGHRLALAARAAVYADPAVPMNATTGPLVAGAARQSDGSVRLSFRNAGGRLRLKHGVGFELSGANCDLSFPAQAANGTWIDARVTGSDDSTVTVAADGLAKPLCVRYNWYNAACLPAVGPELCAIYGKAALDEWLPAPPFIRSVPAT